MPQEYSIMLIDDDEPLRESMSDLLMFSGYNVIPASSGEECLDILAQRIPDLIISDIMLPGIDGFDLHDQIVLHAEWAAVPFIFVSAKAEMRELLERRGFENEMFLAKPFNTDDFLNAIASLLQNPI
jgi:CheY-like chemotaxis protein